MPEPPAGPARPIPLTVIGGYLGAGKTTLLNHLLAQPHERRLGIVVNDFGALGIDAGLLGGPAGGIVDLPNGCVCCTLSAGLGTALDALARLAPPPEHVVVEASGVADPAQVAAWGTVAPYEPGGVVVVADADAVRRRAGDPLVGPEVRRQLAAADLVVVSKTDLVAAEARAALGPWLDELTGGAPRLEAVHGTVPAEVVLGLRVGAPRPAADAARHGDAGPYRTRAWEGGTVADEHLAAVVDGPPPGLLRAKGIVRTPSRTVVLHVVGRRATLAPTDDPGATRVVAIALDDAALDALGDRLGLA